MDRTLQVSFESPQSGWMSLGLRAGGQRLLMAASFKPYDSLRDLAEGLATLLTGGGEVTVKWNCEPEEFDFRLTARGDRVEFDVVRYPDHRRSRKHGQTVFSTRGTKLETGLPFWRALRDLRRRTGQDEFEKNWRRPFPHQELGRLTKAVRSLRRETNITLKP